MKDKLKIVSGILLVSVFLLFILSIAAFFGGNFMRLFGFHYDSHWSVIWFFLWSEILGLPLDFLALGFPRAMFQMEKCQAYQAKLLFVLLQTSFGFFIMYLLDNYLENVSATPTALFAVCFVAALLGMGDVTKEPQEFEKPTEK